MRQLAYIFVCGLVCSFPRHAFSEAKLPCPQGDADHDGICDDVERRTGTDPYSADTDGDGVPDGVEDANQDGVVDPGESDPRVAGLFPGSAPYIPEPMVFDLVRGLGAKKGELEANVLLVSSFRRGRGPTVHWAPEVEWAFADGLAIEFELPMVDRNLEAFKLAFQGTFPSPSNRFAHGVQVIGEYLLTERHVEATVLYLLGGRIGAWSLFSMVGARALSPFNHLDHYEAIINPAVYHDLSERFTVGIELNVAARSQGIDYVAAIPQVHYQVSQFFRVQFGGGVAINGGEHFPMLATRIIIE